MEIETVKIADGDDYKIINKSDMQKSDVIYTEKKTKKNK